MDNIIIINISFILKVSFDSENYNIIYIMLYK